MAIQMLEPISKDQLDEYINKAARAAGYENGFGIQGCDLSQAIWWAAYCRQSLDQQTQNNRLPKEQKWETKNQGGIGNDKSQGFR
jgi:dipeptide/tripeptide permease